MRILHQKIRLLNLLLCEGVPYLCTTKKILTIKTIIMNTKKSVKEKVVKSYIGIESAVVDGYKALEEGVVMGYKNIEDSVVGAYKAVENSAVKFGKSLVEEYDRQMSEKKQK